MLLSVARCNSCTQKLAFCFNRYLNVGLIKDSKFLKSASGSWLEILLWEALYSLDAQYWYFQYLSVSFINIRDQIRKTSSGYSTSNNNNNNNNKSKHLLLDYSKP